MKVREMTLCAVMAALMAICAWISVPVFEIAFTMQTFAVCLTLGLLGGRLGTISVAVYCALGALGLPVFSGFRGGISVLMGVTGGYIWGFVLGALVYWLLTARLGGKPWSMVLGMVVMLAVCYLCGTLWYLVAYAGTNAVSFFSVFSVCVVPYLIPDAAKLTLAFVLALRLKRFLPKAA